MRPRILIGIVIVVAWLAGVGMMLRRELFRPHIERLAEAALRVTPGAIFYAVLQDGHQVGFASSTVDTATTLIEQRDYFVADLMSDGRSQRTTERTNVAMTRTLRVRAFETERETDQARERLGGLVSGDTLLSVFAGTSTAAPADTQRVPIGGPILVPALVPLAVALESRPEIGSRYVFPVFDPATRAPRDTRFRVLAESVFVLNDSSVFDSTTGVWRGVLPVPTRAWRIAPDASDTGAATWVDEQGRVVAGRHLGYELRRLPYEVAFENWRLESERFARPRSVPAASATRDVHRATVIASRKRPGAPVTALRVIVRGLADGGVDLAGGRQRVRGDTVIVTRESSAALAARYFPVVGSQRRRMPELRQEPFLEVEHREIRELAERLADRHRDPRVIADRLLRWVTDSVRKEATVGIPSALHVLHTRAGDCNEHAQLFVALARAAGLPARVVTGLVRVDGAWYYHAWADVMLRGWVAVDPTFGQFPADAAHLRFVTGGLERPAELLRLVGNLQIRVLEAR